MESIAAFGLAASILQVVQFSCNLISAAQRVYQTGSTARDAATELVAGDLKLLSDKVKLFARPDPKTLGPLFEDSQVRMLAIISNSSTLYTGHKILDVGLEDTLIG